MKSTIQILYLAVMTGVVTAGTYVSCRSQQICHDSSLREAVMWGGCLVLSATIDYLIIVPGGNYLIATA